MDELADLFAEAGCAGQASIRCLDDGREVVLEPDRPVVPASVIKVLVAVEIERQCSDGRLDQAQRVTLRSGARTGGPVGFSLYDDDVEVSLRDLLVPMLTISDNVATDALLGRIGIEACNHTARQLGLKATVLTGDIATMIDSIGQDAGFADWAALDAWQAASHPEADRRAVDTRVAACRALDPGSGSRTTAHDMVRLLEAIWSDAAAPPPACARIRNLMGRQLTRHRLAAGAPPGSAVAAKSGGLVGVVRNEVGVIEHAGGRRYAAAVFTQAAGGTDATINAVIGRVAATAIAHLESD